MKYLILGKVRQNLNQKCFRMPTKQSRFSVFYNFLKKTLCAIKSVLFFLSFSQSLQSKSNEHKKLSVKCLIQNCDFFTGFSKHYMENTGSFRPAQIKYGWH